MARNSRLDMTWRTVCVYIELHWLHAILIRSNLFFCFSFYKPNLVNMDDILSNSSKIYRLYGRKNFKFEIKYSKMEYFVFFLLPFSTTFCFSAYKTT